jgi:hypothetical protein
MSLSAPAVAAVYDRRGGTRVSRVGFGVPAINVNWVSFCPFVWIGLCAARAFPDNLGRLGEPPLPCRRPPRRLSGVQAGGVYGSPIGQRYG